ncbi:hypothetical protein ACTHO0_27775 [Cytobacillus praedii]|uniref:hypothetical protein n=1 Tax=Cytobacillus praedii TaxID=1742358 RepID=UPI003F7E5722
MKIFSKLIVTGVLSLGLLGSSVTWYEPIQVEAVSKKILPDNHTIEQLKVDHENRLIHVGDRKGTLLIRVDQPKTEWNIEWVNWSIQKPQTVSSGLLFQWDKESRMKQAPIIFTYDYLKKGEPTSSEKKYGFIRLGMMSFSDFSNPNYYAGFAVYLPQKYNDKGIYYFSMGGIREAGQIKAYFFHDIDVVEEAMQRVKTGGTFPLMTKVMWGKTELIKGQLGKITVKHLTILWKQLDNGKLEKVRDMKVGEEYRVYRYIEENGGLYGVGGGMFVQKDTSKVLYETPSKKNLRLVKIINGE